MSWLKLVVLSVLFSVAFTYCKREDSTSSPETISVSPSPTSTQSSDTKTQVLPDTTGTPGTPTLQSVKLGYASAANFFQLTSSAKTLGGEYLANNVGGVTKILIDISSLPGSEFLAEDLSFKMSPTGNFNTSTNPLSAWTDGPAVASIALSKSGIVTTVAITFPSGSIVNRWLAMTVKPSSRTGLASSATFVVGHLTGETNAALAGGSFYVTTQDANLVASHIGQAEDLPKYDIDLDGSVTSDDVNAVSAAVSAVTVLKQVTVGL